ncbi:hypothetical protein LMH87_005602 [Akanthomyces muscarius]|uniref:Uncharacterized protein n=1 Tax=Akanthomyces muscarius TaxID=2231603 RepID=A0A9W8US14_AKAMU|nr:hypothetical protein LMH87_005602 [Akanthomyces muscarius]KAJ4163900.1 hypothetical protein LMH87_005602 [Akanthomyces muscarius]
MQWTTLHLTTKGYHWRRLLFRLWMIDRRPCQPKNCHSRTSKGFVPKITGNCVGLAELRLQLFIVHSILKSIQKYTPGQPISREDPSQQMRNRMRLTLTPPRAENDEERQKLHKINRETLWFAVRPATLETDNTGTKPKAEATPKKGEAASGEGKSAPSLTLDE